jgi:hypothetical protein
MQPLNDAAARRFYAWKASHPHQAEDPLLVWAAAWHAGGKDALLRSAQLAELVPRLEELAALFWGGKVEADISDEIAEPSAYWTTER